MRICIYGAGASGGHFAVKLATAGHDVSVIARGAHLDAIREKGLTLRTGETTLTAKPAASDDPKRLGPQDLIIVATKAVSLKPIAAGIAPLLKDSSLVVFPQNGMTWWYPQGLPAALPKPPALPIFELADPFLSAMRMDQVLGGIIYSANEMEAPGIIRNNSPAHNRLEIGPIDGRQTGTIATVRAALEQAGILSPNPGDIRAAVWAKLLTNMSGSVIALLTGSPSSATRDDPGLSDIYRRVVREGLAISAAHGYPLDEKMNPDQMIKRLLHHKPSLLQDYEQHRPMEIGEIVLAPLAFAKALQVPTPTLDVLAALARQRAANRNLL